MENGAKGVEIIVAGKVRGQRAKAMKFKDGFMVKSGNGSRHYIDAAKRHINLKQGVIGIKIAIMLPYDPTGKDGVSIQLPDVIQIKEPKVEEPLACPPKQGYAQNFETSAPAVTLVPFFFW
jgi:small subunit ribosomal protein S3e